MYSAPLAEAAAHVCGLAAGLTAYAVSAAFTHDALMRIRIGMFFSVITNAIVGGHINVIMKDFVSLLVMRPVSAYLGAKLLAYVVHSSA